MILILFSILNLDFIPNSPTITGSTVKEGASNSEDGKTITVDPETSRTIITENGNIIEAEEVYKDIINKILELRKASNAKDLIKTADTFTLLNQEFENIDNPNLITAWREISDCVYDTCEENKYLKLIDIICSLNNAQNENNIIHSLIETSQLWTGKHTTIFSQKLTIINTLIVKENNNALNEKWKTLIDCNGKCSSFHEIIFSMIKILVS